MFSDSTMAGIPDSGELSHRAASIVSESEATVSGLGLGGGSFQRWPFQRLQSKIRVGVLPLGSIEQSSSGMVATLEFEPQIKFNEMPQLHKLIYQKVEIKIFYNILNYFTVTLWSYKKVTWVPLVSAWYSPFPIGQSLPPVFASFHSEL